MSENQPKTEIGRAAVDILVKTMAGRAGLVSAQCAAAGMPVRDEIERIFDAAKAKYLLDVK